MPSSVTTLREKVCVYIRHDTAMRFTLEMVALVDTDSDRALSGDEDACSKLWAVYIGEAGKYNKDLMISWKQDMEGLLIFVCVYAPGS